MTRFNNIMVRVHAPDVNHAFAKIWLHASIVLSQQPRDSPQSLPRIGLDPQSSTCFGIGLRIENVRLKRKS